MLQKLLQNKIAFLFILLCLGGLIAVRSFEDHWFYDPFLDYFKNDYLNLPFPEFDGIKFFLSLSFRFFLNTFFSLLMIYFLFKDVEIIKFLSLIYTISFVLLMAVFFAIILFWDESSNFLLFYIRRFLIQPLLLLLLIPAIYFQKRAE